MMSIVFTVLTLLTILFFFLTVISFSAYFKYFKDCEVLTKKVNEYEEKEKMVNKVDINSTGHYKYDYYDDGFKVYSSIYIPIKVSEKDNSGENFKFDFDFEKFKRDNKRKNTQIMFDPQTMSYLKLNEHQWHKVDTSTIIWAEFKEEDLDIDDFEFEDIFFPKETDEKLEKVENNEDISLTEFEKNDINSFLKFSNISEETKENIKRILNI